jgi:hypothetical protein
VIDVRSLGDMEYTKTEPGYEVDDQLAAPIISTSMAADPDIEKPKLRYDATLGDSKVLMKLHDDVDVDRENRYTRPNERTHSI